MNSKINFKKDSITLEQAKKRFHEYYDNKHKDSPYKNRAKMFDVMYQKQKSKTLTPDTPGSARYLLPHGPKTFDMKGVDWFPEGTIMNVNDDITVVSRGYSNKKENDPENTEIYGPRVKKDNMLYSEYFRNKYYDRQDLQYKNLVDYHWNKRDDDVESIESFILPKNKQNDIKPIQINPDVIDHLYSDQEEDQQDSDDDVSINDVSDDENSDISSDGVSEDEHVSSEDANSDNEQNRKSERDEDSNGHDGFSELDELSSEQSGGGILFDNFNKDHSNNNIYWKMMKNSEMVLNNKL